MPKLDHLFDFVAIVDAGSISAAARRLGLPRATLSRRLTQLEEDLQTKLVHREPRRLSLTHAGERLLEHARSMVEVAEMAWESVRDAQQIPTGRLRLSLPPTHLFTDLLVGFRRAYPEVELQVIGTPSLLDLTAEGIDVALRFGPVRSGGLIARRLWSDATTLVASPAYLRQRGVPTVPEDLAAHEVLVGFEAGWLPVRRWPLVAGGDVEVRSRFVTHDPLTQMSAALEGVGIALLPEGMTRPYVQSGQLQVVLAGVVGGHHPVALVFPQRQFLPTPARAFIDFVTQFYRDAPYPDGARVAPRLLPPLGPPDE